MPQLFKETDDIIRMGKYLFFKIPTGNRCKSCPLLGSYSNWKGIVYYCELRKSIGLLRDEDGPIKSDDCPRPRKEET
jgi:hypothetical protein